MFEKEAEEYFETECLHSYADTEEQLKEDVVPAFQKGAEFGYNKAKEEGKVVVEHFEAYGQCRDSRRIADLEAKNATLELKIKKITQHLEPQTTTALFEQVEEEAKQEELLNSTLDENKEIYKKMADLDTALEDCTESLTDARIKIKELEKENTELNDKLNNLSKVAEVRLANWQKLDKKNKELTDQLTKAKELLIGFVSKMKNSVYSPYEKDLVEQAEQFLKESE